MTFTRPAALDPAALVAPGQHWIGGEWRAALDGRTLDVLDPSTGAALAAVPAGGAADVDAAIDAAEAAFPAWRALDPTKRAAVLRRWADLLLEHGRELGILESMEVGRPYVGPADVGTTVHSMAGLADKITGETLPVSRPTMLGFTLREPLGVCASIVPWNSPAILMMKSLAPALTAGNVMVVKPAEDAPLTCLLIAKLAGDAGIPPGVVNMVTGYGAEAGAALAGHRGIRHLSFTGSGETGKAVMRACADNLVPLHLELGGKTPQIVFRDADLDRAIPTIVRQLTRNAGQICYAGTRLLVDAAIKDDVVAAVEVEMAKVRVGAWNEDVEMGPLINAKQQQRVLDYVGVGVAEGARLVVGGAKPGGASYEDGFFVEPTMFTDVTSDMRIASEEIFGPVLAVLDFEDVDDAIAVANSTPYGLATAVWTRDVGRAVQMAKGVESGQVYVNTFGSAGVVGAPFGGYKRSGFGRNGGPETVREYTQVKAVIVDAS